MTKFLSCAILAGLISGLSAGPVDASPIKHVVMIMQENRSFDSYFGTFPGADGLTDSVCVPTDPSQPSGACIRPFHDPNQYNAGGPHTALDADDDLASNAFVHRQAFTPLNNCKKVPTFAHCAQLLDGIARHDVMGYHDEHEIQNYWAYAKHFVLQDRMFEPVRSWSRPAHIYMTSEWNAKCTDKQNVATCKTSTESSPGSTNEGENYPWVSLFELMDRHKVSWKYYLASGEEPDCENDEITCDPQHQQTGVPGIWNPMPAFSYVKAQGAAYLKNHNPEAEQFLADVKAGTLPAVSWVIPNNAISEHPAAGVTEGMDHVTAVVNAIMQSKYWDSTVIYIAWDDWGGFYDHVVPPTVDYSADNTTQVQGYGLRVPGIMVSSWARAGMIDHATLSFDTYATFIEDLFMGGARLNPKALGKPDSRPTIRDALTEVRYPDGHFEKIGNLMDELDFKQTPLKPLILSPFIPTGLLANCNPDHFDHCTEKTVTLSWASLDGPDVTKKFTYHVLRNGVVLPQCSGVATSCVDTPGKGDFHYRIYSVDNQGNRSPNSGALEAIMP